MTLNCDSANKLIKRISADRESLLAKERDSATFTSTMADMEADRPAYNFKEVQCELDSMAEKIFNLKHAVHVFNCTTKLPSGVTIDEALVRLPVLTEKKERYDRMRRAADKRRGRYSTVAGDPEYTFANFDANDAENAYQTVCDELTLLQQELNTANLTLSFEVEL